MKKIMRNMLAVFISLVITVAIAWLGLGIYVVYKIYAEFYPADNTTYLGQ